MKERPILMSGPMVRATLLDLKTQARRVIRPQPPEGSRWDTGSRLFVLPGSRLGVMRHCPYGVPGDRLWVREAFSVWHCSRNDFGALEPDYQPNGIPKQRPLNNRYGGTVLFYRADGELDDCHWRPSIHMPRWASRITLEVIAVRAERVQNISPADAVAEGCPAYIQYKPRGHEREPAAVVERLSPVENFRKLWDSLNAKRGYPCSDNPWVWVVEFRRLAHRQDGADVP